MSQTGLEAFDKTVQTANIWLNEIMEAIGPDRANALHALRAVLHPLRDRLPVEEAAHLGAQLPMLVRGLYYENWRPQVNPTPIRKQGEFLACIQDELDRSRPMDPKDVARAVLKVIDEHVDRGEVEKVKHSLPAELRGLFPGGHKNEGATTH